MRTYGPSRLRGWARTRITSAPIAPMIRNCLTSMSAPFLEDVFCHGQRRENVRPACVEGELRKDLRGFGLRQAVIHRPVEVIGHLRHLPRSNQGADSDETAIAGRKI